MNKILMALGVILSTVFGGQAMAVTEQAIPEVFSQYSEQAEGDDFAQGLKIQQLGMQNCWAYTTCHDGSVISCSVSGTRNCTWEYRKAQYVSCTAFNLDGTYSWDRQFCRR